MKKLLQVVAALGIALSLNAEAPSAVALRNARIVTVSGPVIAKGTVLIRDWNAAAVKTLLEGSGAALPISYTNRYGRRRSYHAHFEGVIEMLRRRYTETTSQNTKDELERYMATRPCPAGSVLTLLRYAQLDRDASSWPLLRRVPPMDGRRRARELGRARAVSR